VSEKAPSPAATLQRLYLTLFLRGRSARGLKKDKAPQTVGRKLRGTLALYTLVGLVAIPFSTEGTFVLSFYLHGMSLLFLGMFIAASAGEILFNKDEAEILLHRPVDARTLLWAKVAVLVRVSLWITCAFNVAGMIAGTMAGKGSPWFAPVHFASTCLAALFCTGSVVLLYQLCLRWFGRDRLDNLMTTAQVMLAVVMVAGSQLIPQLMTGMKGATDPLAGKSWLFFLPPAWFAALDEVLLGRASEPVLVVAGAGLLITAAVLVLAFGRMARAYEEGLQTLAESQPRKKARVAGGRRPLDRLMDGPLLGWLLRDPVTRASFRLTAAYLFRDRDMKLRLYPGLAPVLVVPMVFLIQGMSRQDEGWGIAFAGGYLGLLPLMALNLLQFSQHCQAADLYRLAPVAGPAPFIHGAARAVAVLLALPGVALVLIVIAVMPGGIAKAALLFPGLLAMPAFALIPGAIEKSVLLSKPTEEAKSATRGGSMVILMIASLAIPSLAVIARTQGMLGAFLIVETVVAIVVCWLLSKVIAAKKWDPLE
jgi:ABC-2 type transport system permease protein